MFRIIFILCNPGYLSSTVVLESKYFTLLHTYTVYTWAAIKVEHGLNMFNKGQYLVLLQIHRKHRNDALKEIKLWWSHAYINPLKGETPDSVAINPALHILVRWKDIVLQGYLWKQGPHSTSH